MTANLLYLGSLILSLFNMVMTIVIMFASEESDVWKVFGYKEDYILIGAAIVLLIVGFISDREEIEL